MQDSFMVLAEFFYRMNVVYADTVGAIICEALKNKELVLETVSN